MKKLLRYPFLLLLVLSMAAAAPLIWEQLGLLPDRSAEESQPPAPSREPVMSENPEAPAPPEPSAPDRQPPPTLLPPQRLPEVPQEPSSTPDDTPESLPEEPAGPEKPEDPFANALFVGDSRTVGIQKYAGIEGADFFASTGMSVYNLFDRKVDAAGQKDLLLTQLLAQKSYDRIFVMLGINELGYNMDKTVETYRQVVASLRELQPQAYIHIQANLHVTKSKSDGDKLYNNGNINKLNEGLAALADGETVFYLDVNPAFDDENGALGGDLSGDGVHPYGKCYATWADWLLENTPA